MAVALVAPQQAVAGSAQIAGVKMSCFAAKKIIQHKDIPGPGFAMPDQGVILLGPQYLKAYKPLVQRFIFLHECGHQYVGTDETAADCWAAKAGKRQGWLTASGIKQVCQAFWNTAGSAYHLPGPQRCDALMQCFGGATGGPKTAAKGRSKKRRASP